MTESNSEIPPIPPELTTRFGLRFNPETQQRVDYRFNGGMIERLYKIGIRSIGHQRFEFTLKPEIAFAIDDLVHETLAVGSWVNYQSRVDRRPHRLLDLKILDLKSSIQHAADEIIDIPHDSNAVREIIYYYH